MTGRSTLLTAAFLALALAAAPAYADGSLSSFPHKTVPVLVKVNSQGKVTSISPALKLPPGVRKLIRQSVQEMITGPAKYHGQPIASQLVMFIVPEATSRADGQYDVRFTSVKNQPVPPGMWRWLDDNGRRLALVNESDLGRDQSGHLDRRGDAYYFDYTASSRSAPLSTPSRSQPPMAAPRSSDSRAPQTPVR